MGAQNTSPKLFSGPSGFSIPTGLFEVVLLTIYPLIHLLYHHSLSLWYPLFSLNSLFCFTQQSACAVTPPPTPTSEGLFLLISLFVSVCARRTDYLSRDVHVDVCREQISVGRCVSLWEGVEVRRWCLYLDASVLTCGNITDAIFRMSGFYENGGNEGGGKRVRRTNDHLWKWEWIWPMGEPMRKLE